MLICSMLIVARKGNGDGKVVAAVPIFSVVMLSNFLSFCFGIEAL